LNIYTKLNDDQKQEEPQYVDLPGCSFEGFYSVLYFLATCILPPSPKYEGKITKSKIGEVKVSVLV